MIPHFSLQQDKQEYLIIRMGDAFHIIDCNEALTKEKRLAILESGCTPAQMQEMGLSGMTISRADLEAITITGCGFQDEVIFYLGKRRKLRYWFPKAYEQKRVDDFFRGIPRIQYKTRFRVRGGRGQDWHVREQEPDVRNRLKAVALGLKIASGLTCACILIWSQWRTVWLCLALLLTLAGLYLAVCFELYFTLMGTEEYRKAGYSGEIISLNFFPFLPLGCFLFWMDRYTAVEADLCMVYGIVAGVLLAGILWFCLREVQENAGHAFVVLFVSVALCWCAAEHANHYFAPNPMIETPARVVDMEGHRSRRHSDYYLKVVQEDGTWLTLDVGSSTYREAGIGDTVIVHSRVGALGVEYAMFGGFAE